MSFFYTICGARYWPCLWITKFLLLSFKNPNFVPIPFSITINNTALIRPFTLYHFLFAKYWVRTELEILSIARVSDPHHFSADPNPAFHFNADPDPDPAPNQGDPNLRPLAHRPSRPPFWASTPPFWASTALYDSIFLSLVSSWTLSLMRILIRIRIRLPKNLCRSGIWNPVNSPALLTVTKETGKNKGKGFLASVFDAMIRYIYSGNDQTVAGIRDLDQLFRLYILADKVRLDLCQRFWSKKFLLTLPFWILGTPRFPCSTVGIDPGLVFYHTSVTDI